MAKQSFTQKNFLAILAFGVMVLATFAAMTAINSSPAPVVQAHATR